MDAFVAAASTGGMLAGGQYGAYILMKAPVLLRGGDWGGDDISRHLKSGVIGKCLLLPSLRQS